MTIIWEDEHYIYEEISSNWNTCTIRRTEKPAKKEFARRIDTWAYILTPISTSEEYEDIFKVHFVSKEDPRFSWVYDFEKKEFEEWFQDSLKTRFCWTEEECAEFTKLFKENIELSVEIYRDIEEKIETMREKIADRENLISILDLHWAETFDLKLELKEMRDTLQNFEEKLHPKK